MRVKVQSGNTGEREQLGEKELGGLLSEMCLLRAWMLSYVFVACFVGSNHCRVLPSVRACAYVCQIVCDYSPQNEAT